LRYPRHHVSDESETLIGEDAAMIIDTHTHVWSFPSYRDLSQHIKTTEDLIAFRTRYPDLYKCSLTEPPIDNSDELIADMDRNGVALTLVQARPVTQPTTRLHSQ
jgi:hypothetical protein